VKDKKFNLTLCCHLLVLTYVLSLPDYLVHN